MRANRPEWYVNRDPMQSKLQELLDCGFYALKKAGRSGKNGYHRAYNPHKFTIAEVFQVVTIILDVALRDSVEASLHGCVIIGDMGGTTLGHVTQIGPRILMHMLNAFTNCFPLGIKSFNYINTPEIANIIMILIRYFLNNKMKKRLHVYTHKTTPDYFKNVPANILPAEYGGTDGTIQELAAHWKKVMEENRDWFIDDKKYIPVL